MSSRNNNYNNISNNNNNNNNNGTGTTNDEYFANHLSRFIGETVTIFTTSGGVSGCGFTGLLMGVNCNFVRLSTRQGAAPAVPLSDSICGNGTSGCMDAYCLGSGSNGGYDDCVVGSVCDIPIDRIAAFCHNAV